MGSFTLIVFRGEGLKSLEGLKEMKRGIYMVQEKFQSEFKKLVNSPLINNLSKHLNQYESRVKEIVSQLELKSPIGKVTREQAKKRLDEISVQFKKTRVDVEHRVVTLLNTEGKKFNKKVTELIKYLKTVTNNEKLASESPAPAKKKKASDSREIKAATNGATKRKPVKPAAKKSARKVSKSVASLHN